ncbi:MAG: hypothetical protein AB7V13_25315 [Pseudorhodoplanes sp.]|uniref:hypothetical protein n=1 Tax=Pseudorhodoplanes sp. TaxID=1934341 RepID=UPI003D0A1E71
MADAEASFERARRAFRLAAEARTIASMRVQAELGLALLEHAETSSAVVALDSRRAPRVQSDG